MRSRFVLVAASAAIVLGGALIVPAAYARIRGDSGARVIDSAMLSPHSGRPQANAAQPPAPPPVPAVPTLAVQPVSVKVNGFYSWALLDRKTGKIAGRNVTATNSTESMVKVWLVSDYLRRTAAAGKQPSAERLKQASTAIRDSNDNSAQSLYVAGGGNSVIQRMISTCKLTETSIYSGWWSRTQISARDAVRLGGCVADGRAAGPKWTAWVLNEMRHVRGTTAAKDQHTKTGGGRWGIIDGLPDEIISQGVSIKNGWTPIWADGKWHINCLAVTNDWALAVLMRFPVKLGLPYGANVCRQVAEQLVVQPGVPTG